VRCLLFLDRKLSLSTQSFEITRLCANVGDQLFSDGGITSQKNGYLACGSFYRNAKRPLRLRCCMTSRLVLQQIFVHVSEELVASSSEAQEVHIVP
jgi:hypothetical protein